MPSICPHNGHVISYPKGKVCSQHGVPWFSNCERCGVRWDTVSKSYSGKPTHGTNFCANCATPGRWLTRSQLIEWLKSNIKASPEVPASERHDLLDILSKLEDAKADDTKTVAAWKKIQHAAPKVWRMAKPVIDTLIADEVKKLLGL